MALGAIILAVGIGFISALLEGILYIALLNASAKGTLYIGGFGKHVCYLAEGGDKVLLYLGRVAYRVKGEGLYILSAVFIIIKRLFNRKRQQIA